MNRNKLQKCTAVQMLFMYMEQMHFSSERNLSAHLWYSLLCVFPEIALQKLNEQKDIFTLGDWLVPALMGKMAVKSIWRKIQDHGWWQNDRNL